MPQLKFSVFLLIVLIVLPMSASSQKNKANDPEKQTQAQRAILEAEESIFTAVKNRDTGALDRILTTDFVYRSPGNPDVAKADFLKLSASFPYKILSVWGEELKVNVYGSTAVLTGLQFAKAQTGEGKEETSAVMFTDVFVKQGGKWLLSLAHAIDLPQV